MNELQVLNIEGVECYEKDGTVYLKLETVARGLGFTRIADSGNEVVRWERVDGYLKDLGVPTCGHDDFIPENIFYRLAMKAKNEVAEKFQSKIADEVIPSIRKHGAYMTPQTLEQALLSPDFLMQLAQRLKEEQQARKEAEYNAHLLDLDNRRMQPKADYFDELVEKNLLTSFRETAKMFHVEEKDMIRFLLDNRYLYRSQSGKLLPYATRPDNGLFEVKEAYDPKSGWRGIQTYVTPRGRETLRLLLVGKPESGLWGFRPPDPPEEMTEAEGIRVERYLTEQARKKRRKQNK